MLSGLLRTMRPHQWVKNLVVLAPLVFARELFDLHSALRAGAGFALFCALASAVYVLNDLVDVEADRAHPSKKNRPIASGRVTEAQAKIALGVLVVIAIAGGVALGWTFLMAALGYLGLNLAYSFKLKQIAYVDVLCITAGFELRVLGGSFAAQVPPSAYLLIVIFLAATFLGLGKRAHELAAMAERAAKSGGEKAATRKVLGAYDLRVLTPLLYATGSATVITYVVYTLDPSTMDAFGTRWLAVTTLFTLIGVLRFTYLVRRKADAESPTDAMLKDPPFLLNLVSWALCVLLVIYFT
ncbi:MAG: UbiA prenyltransferase family protein [Myxococcota bacterium]|nr:UbiA prenyltransferase family protein [Myxococcota bacterium]